MLKHKNKLLAVLLSVLLCVSGCGDYTVINDKKEVAAVYWHEYNRYSVSIVNDGVVNMYRLPYRVLVFTGAKKPWYLCKGKHRSWDGVYKGSYCELHLRSIDNLLNASWNHGKFGSGKTERIN